MRLSETDYMLSRLKTWPSVMGLNSVKVYFHCSNDVLSSGTGFFCIVLRKCKKIDYSTSVKEIKYILIVFSSQDNFKSYINYIEYQVCLLSLIQFIQHILTVSTTPNQWKTIPSYKYGYRIICIILNKGEAGAEKCHRT